MLHLVYGKDSFRSRQKLNELLLFFLSKIGKFGVFKIAPENFSKNEFDELLKSKGLFDDKRVVVCENLLDDKITAEFIAKNLEQCAVSNNIFIFWENEIDEKNLKLFKKFTKEVYEFKFLIGNNLKKWIDDKCKNENIKISTDIQDKIISNCGSDLWCASKEIEKCALNKDKEYRIAGVKESFNLFSVCDAVAEKDRKKSWILFQKAVLLGVPAEEVFWKVWWQVKNLLLIKILVDSNKGATLKNPQGRTLDFVKETNLHPFVIKKSLVAVKNFEMKELNQLSWKLLELYHNTRRGLADFEIGLEKILISL